MPRIAARLGSLSLCLLALLLCFGCAGGEEIRLDWPQRIEIDNAMQVRALSVSPDGNRIGLISQDEKTVVVDRTALRPRWFAHEDQPEWISETATDLRFTADNDKLLAWNRNFLARIDTGPGAYRVFEAHARTSDPLRSAAAVSPDGRFRAIGFTHGALEIYDVETGERVRRLRGHKDAARVIAEYMLVSGIWTAPNRNAAELTAACYSADGTLIATGDSLGGLRVWNAADGKLKADLIRRELILMHRVLWVELSPDGRYLAAGSLTETSDRITIFDVAENKKVLEIEDVGLAGAWSWSPTNPLPSIILTDFSPDGRYFYCPRRSQVLVWDLQKKEQTSALRGHTGDVLGLAVDPNGRWLVSTARDRTCRVWDLETSDVTALFVVLPESDYVYFDLTAEDVKRHESEDADDYYDLVD